MSYLVGYGSSYPVQVHHRGASIESINLLPSKVGCIDGFEKWYSLNDSNPNVIVGALVGGPDRKDEFSDRRGNYEQTVPSIAGSAPLAGLFGKVNSVFGNSGTYPTLSWNMIHEQFKLGGRFKLEIAQHEFEFWSSWVGLVGFVEPDLSQGWVDPFYFQLELGWYFWPD